MMTKGVYSDMQIDLIYIIHYINSSKDEKT